MNENCKEEQQEDNALDRAVLRDLTSPSVLNINTLAKMEVDPTEVLKNYEVSIRFLDKGCLVNVGCKSFAFNTNREMLQELKEYIENPSEKTKEYY